MKFFLSIFLVLFLLSCNVNTKIIQSDNKLFTVFKIDSLNNYYMIYAKKQDSIFKIVSKKGTNCNDNKIEVKGKYLFKVKSNKSSADKINGVEIFSENVDCYIYDSETSICLERKNKIFYLYNAENLKGLCLIDKSSVKEKIAD